IQLFNISGELRELKLFDIDTNTKSIKFSVDCLNLTKRHIELVKIFSRLSGNLMRLKEIQLQREHLDNQLSMFACQNNTIGYITNFTRKISLLISSLDDIQSEDGISFRWPCGRLCKYITSKYSSLYSPSLEDNKEVSLSSHLYFGNEHEIQ
ncbi:unnamed protein product, partial [Schistosoma turkestanicum]